MKFGYILFFLLLSLAKTSYSQDVTLVAMEYPPFTGSSMPNDGVILDVARNAFDKVGYKVSVEYYPWVRAMRQTEDGHADGMAGVWFSAEREKAFYYSDPILPNKMGFYKRKGEDIKYSSFEDLKAKGYLLGSVKGYIQLTGLEESGIDIHYVAKDIQSFKILAAGRVDLIVVDKDYARHILVREEFDPYRGKIQWATTCSGGEAATLNIFSESG